MGKLFAEKNELILQLRKVAFRDKFDLHGLQRHVLRLIVVRNHINGVSEQLEVRTSIIVLGW